MQMQRRSPKEVLVAFASMEERDEFFAAGNFVHAPLPEQSARWAAKDNGTDRSRWVEVVSNPREPHDLAALVLKFAAHRKQEPIMVQGYRAAAEGTGYKPPKGVNEAWLYGVGWGAFFRDRPETWVNPANATPLFGGRV